LGELISEGDGEEDLNIIDFSLRTLIRFVEDVEDDKNVKEFHVYV